MGVSIWMFSLPGIGTSYPLIAVPRVVHPRYVFFVSKVCAIYRADPEAALLSDNKTSECPVPVLYKASAGG